MPELLQVVADRHTLFLTDLGNAIEEEARTIGALPMAQQSARALEAARVSLEEALAFPNFATSWAAMLEKRLRQGLNGDNFRLLVRAGDLLIRTYVSNLDRVTRLWDQVEVFRGEDTEVKDARTRISSARTQLSGIQAQVAEWRKLAERKPPDLDPARLEHGAEQIRQGRYKTAEQLLEEIRNRNPSA